MNWNQLIDQIRYEFCDILLFKLPFSPWCPKLEKNLIFFQIEKRKLPLENISPYIDEDVKPKKNLSIFLGFTSNMTSCGVRDVIRFLVKHKMVDCLVTTAGGIEEDFIKCLAPTYVDDFHYKGAEARKRGLNRIGNLIAPNNGYCKFEEWLRPIMDKMLEQQNSVVRFYYIILID